MDSRVVIPEAFCNKGSACKVSVAINSNTTRCINFTAADIKITTFKARCPSLVFVNINYAAGDVNGAVTAIANTVGISAGINVYSSAMNGNSTVAV